VFSNNNAFLLVGFPARATLRQPKLRRRNALLTFFNIFAILTVIIKSLNILVKYLTMAKAENPNAPSSIVAFYTLHVFGRRFFQTLTVRPPGTSEKPMEYRRSLCLSPREEDFLSTKISAEEEYKRFGERLFSTGSLHCVSSFISLKRNRIKKRYGVYKKMAVTKFVED
jgi:hypothetical protein